MPLTAAWVPHVQVLKYDKYFLLCYSTVWCLVFESLLYYGLNEILKRLGPSLQMSGDFMWVFQKCLSWPGSWGPFSSRAPCFNLLCSWKYHFLFFNFLQTPYCLEISPGESVRLELINYSFLWVSEMLKSKPVPLKGSAFFEHPLFELGVSSWVTEKRQPNNTSHRELFVYNSHNANEWLSAILVMVSVWKRLMPGSDGLRFCARGVQCCSGVLLNVPATSLVFSSMGMLISVIVMARAPKSCE